MGETAGRGEPLLTSIVTSTPPPEQDREPLAYEYNDGPPHLSLWFAVGVRSDEDHRFSQVVMRPMLLL
jgi:hypothetical protein